MLLSYADACSVKTGGVVSAGGVLDVEFVLLLLVELLCASASGTGSINGIDGGMNSILTRKIPKNTCRLFFCVVFYLIIQQYEYDRYASNIFLEFSLEL